MTYVAHLSRGLVLGAGGALGAAWMIGALSALRDVEAYEPRSVDMLVGTSAGSVLASLLASQVSVEEMLDRLDGSTAPHVEGTGAVNPFDVHAALAAIPRPQLLPGNLLLAARAVTRPRSHTFMTLVAGLAPRGRGDLAPLADFIREAQGPGGWPLHPTTWIVAMDFDTGRRIVFGRSGAPVATLPDAVIASSSAPGFFPPVRIGAARYVDGGGISMTNADVLRRANLDEVLILAPMLAPPDDPRRSSLALADRRLRNAFTRRLRFETAQLEACGTAVRVLGPTADDLEIMGVNLMDPTRRCEVAERAMQTTRARLEQPTGPRAA
ncbi:MAG TPA: patatin-like phospholipase family protein [Jatrophihabitans sp.]|nr:patatin-like phospholipase family protein [Jatrophihabitans sp.]